MRVAATSGGRLALWQGSCSAEGIAARHRRAAPAVVFTWTEMLVVWIAAGSALPKFPPVLPVSIALINVPLQHTPSQKRLLEIAEPLEKPEQILFTTCTASCTADRFSEHTVCAA